MKLFIVASSIFLNSCSNLSAAEKTPLYRQFLFELFAPWNKGIRWTIPIIAGIKHFEKLNKDA